MPDVPTKEPETLQAGDTVTWSKSLSDYPANDGWTLTYYLIRETSAGTGINFAASADGSDHLVEVAAATTAAWTAGKYRILGRVSKTGENTTTVFGPAIVEILPNLASSADYRSHAKKVLDAIETVLEGRATKELLSFSIEGQNIQNIPHTDLLVLRDRYRAEYNNELAAARIKAGLGSGRRILTRFN